MTERRITVAELCTRYHVDIAHGQHVGHLTAELFNLTQPVHKLDTRYRRVSYIAGLLHNVAYAAGRPRHHSRGRDILLNTPLSDVTDEERELIAVAIAFHRKRWKQTRLGKEEAFTSLKTNQQPIALIISALVRIADGLEHSHSQTTNIIRTYVRASGIEIAVNGPFAAYDGSRGNEKTDLWQEITGIPIIVRLYDERLDGVLEPPPGVIPLHPSDRMDEAGRKVLRHYFAAMLDEESKIRTGEQVQEAVHSMHVSVLQMYAALELFGPYYTSQNRTWISNGLKLARQSLGQVRDLDVTIEGLHTYIDAYPDRRDNLRFLVEHLTAEHRRAFQDFKSYLDSRDYDDFVQRMVRFLEAPLAVSDVPVLRYVISSEIYSRFERVRSFEKLLRNPSPSAMNRLRIYDKRLRYALEFFYALLGPDVEPVLHTLTKAQDHLSAMNDARIAQKLLRRSMQKILKQAQQNGHPVNSINAIVSYLETRETEMESLMVSFPEVWEELVSPSLRRKLAMTISVI